jgi:hypothetical protein
MTAALEAATTAGLDIAKVEIDKAGKITLTTGKLNRCDPQERSDDWADVRKRSQSARSL